MEITDATNEIENIYAYLYSIEASMEEIFYNKVSEDIEVKFKEISKESLLNSFNINRLILN